MSAILDIVIPFLRTEPAEQRTIEALADTLIPLLKLYPEADRDTALTELCVAIEDAGLVALRSFTSLEDDWDWAMPTLRLRKDIWENFPVSVVPLGKGVDGAERHAVVWHHNNFAAWREERTERICDWLDYEDDQTRRLYKALAASTRWTVEPAITEEQLCVIRMNFIPREDVPAEGGERTEIAAAPVAVKAAVVTETPVQPAAGCTPVLVRLNDIRAHFPVVWKQIPGTRINVIELHGKQMRDRGLNPATTKEDLLRALRASASWRVLRAETPTEVCRIELP